MGSSKEAQSVEKSINVSLAGSVKIPPRIEIDVNLVVFESAWRVKCPRKVLPGDDLNGHHRQIYFHFKFLQ